MKNTIPASKTHCMIVHAYYPLGETRVEREALALVDHGYSVDVLCLRAEGEAADEEIDGIHVYRLPVQRRKTRGLAGQMLEYIWFFVLVMIKLLQLYPRRRYGTLQAHNPPDFLIFSALIQKLSGARLILDIHDIMPEFMAAKTGKPINSLPVRLTIWQEQLSCRFADQVITVTDLWRERLIERGTPSEKVGVVMNLADERVFQPLAPERRASARTPRFHLIYHGTFKQYYGLDVLIRAVHLVKNEIPDVQVTLQGMGEFAAEMAALVEQLDLAENVAIHNFALPATQLPDLICQADVGVVPNREDLFTGELLPTKLLEYVALGVPVIAARTRVISKYFDDSMVRFFEPGDPRSLAGAILDAYACRDSLGDQVIETRRFTERYNWKKMAEYYTGIVDRLATRDRQPVVEQPG